MTPSDRSHFKVVVVGAGFGGLGTAIRLLQEGRQDFVVLERAHDVGGVWRDNSYPGCACDVESVLYCFSFAPNPAWTRTFSPQGEILAYLRACAERFGVLPYIRFGNEVRDATWDDSSRRWRLSTSHGLLSADVLVSGVGALSEPAMPELPGLATFEGRAFHSARWDHAYPLDRKRVAVIGTGASAIQFVPAIQPRVERLHVFQRTPPWILPRRDRALSPFERHLFQALPATQRLSRTWTAAFRDLMVFGFQNPRAMKVLERLALRHLERQVPDAALRRRLTPSYRVGCKRILLSDDYLVSLTRENTELVTDPVREVRARSIVTADATERPVDAIVFGTGFRVTDPPVADHVRGRDGRTLAEHWHGSPRAHLGTTVVGFPNFFMLQGPNSGLGHSSVIAIIESQIEHVLNALRFMDRSGMATIEPREGAQAAFVAEVDATMRGTVWTAGGCASWYLDQTGRNCTLWPRSVAAFKRRVEGFDPAEYDARA